MISPYWYWNLPVWSDSLVASDTVRVCISLSTPGHVLIPHGAVSLCLSASLLEVWRQTDWQHEVLLEFLWTDDKWYQFRTVMLSKTVDKDTYVSYKSENSPGWRTQDDINSDKINIDLFFLISLPEITKHIKIGWVEIFKTWRFKIWKMFIVL